MDRTGTEEWLKAWAAENVRGKDEGHISSLAIECRDAARQAGIGEVALNEATGGDLENFLRGQQNRGG